jgi:hypothetical protein
MDSTRRVNVGHALGYGPDLLIQRSEVDIQGIAIPIHDEWHCDRSSHNLSTSSRPISGQYLATVTSNGVVKMSFEIELLSDLSDGWKCANTLHFHTHRDI